MIVFYPSKIMEEILSELNCKYRFLISHPNDWLVDRSWMKSMEDIELFEDENYGEFVARIKLDLNRFLLPNYNGTKLSLTRKESMSVGAKKLSECCMFMPVLQSMSNSVNTTKIVDIGGGKGVLCKLLKKTYNFEDCVVVEGQELLCNKARTEGIDVINCWVDENTLDKMFSEKITENCILSALHTCGDLSTWVLKAFCNNSSVRGLLHSPCCYHKSSNLYVPLSNECRKLCIKYDFMDRLQLLSTKNIASHSTITWKNEKDILNWLYKLEYRTRFKAECYAAGFDYSNSVFHPISGQLKKMKFDNYEVYRNYFIESLSLAPVNDIKFDPKLIKSLHLAYLVRFVLVGQLLEYLFLLDKQQYVKEQGYECKIYKLFESDSPRCHVLYSEKSAGVQGDDKN
eukprot:NODE_208_length_14728_cov_0.400164.p3 type:complete len:400 gc:universal NODE_208_length_14728_cov_0.400164:7292-6093(-)